MERLRNNLIERSISLLLVFALVCGLFSGLRFNVTAAGDTVSINGTNANVNVNGYDSVSGSNYIFSDTLTIEIDSPVNTAFNRYTLVYTSSAHLQGIIYYTQGSSSYSEEFFLEPGTNADFSSLIDGYFNRQQGTRIAKIELKPINTGSAAFSLAQINTTVRDVKTGEIYIENARYKLGIDLSWGGSISYLEDKNDRDNTITNMLNNHDAGRLVQQSYYGKLLTEEDIGEFEGNKEWPYNPVQAGDGYDNKSKIVDFVESGNSIYVKCRPLDWGKNNVLTPSYMENLYTITEDYVCVDNRFVDFTTYSHPDAYQEIPAFYTINYYDTFTFYNGTKPWTGDSLTVKSKLGFWGDNDGRDNTFYIADGNTETWCAWTRGSNGYGIGLYTPDIDLLYAGRHGDTDSKEPNGTKGEPCDYVAPEIIARIKNCEAYEYRYLITSGTVSDMRSVFTENRDIVNRAWDTVKVSLPIDGDTLRKVNDAVGLYGKEGAEGPSYQSIGAWQFSDQGTPEYLLPFDGYAPSGTGPAILIQNYGNFIRISKDIDLSKYSKAYITYSAGTDYILEGNRIGFFSGANWYCDYQGNLQTEGLIASAALPFDNVPGSGWNVLNTVEIDLSEVNHEGELYLAYYMKNAYGICIKDISFELADPDVETPGFDEVRVRMAEDDTETNQTYCAVVLGQPGNYYSVHFKTNDAFSGVFIPQWTDVNPGGYVDYTVSVYNWDTDYNTSVTNAQPVASVNGRSTDHSDIYVRFNESVKAGEYVLVFTVTNVENSNAGIHLKTGVLPKDQDSFERFAYASAGSFSGRFAAFRLIADISADTSDFFGTLGLPLAVELTTGRATGYESFKGYSEFAFKLTVPEGYLLQSLIIHEAQTYGSANPADHSIKFKVYQWNADYSFSTSGAVAMLDEVTVPSVENGNDIVAKFNEKLSAGTYLIVMEVISGDIGFSWGVPDNATMTDYDVSFYRAGTTIFPSNELGWWYLPYAGFTMVKSDEVSSSQKLVSMTTTDSGNADIWLYQDGYYGVHFNTKNDFTGVLFKQWPGVDGGYVDFTLSVYEWNTDYNTSTNNAPVASKKGIANAGGVYIYVGFDNVVPAGEYVMVLSVDGFVQPVNGGYFVLESGTVPADQNYFESFINSSDPTSDKRYAAFKLMSVVEGSKDAMEDVFDWIGPNVIELTTGQATSYDHMETDHFMMKLTVPEGYSLKNLNLHATPTFGIPADQCSINFNVYKWNADYTTTINGAVIDTVYVPTHVDMQDLIADFDGHLLPAGTYLIDMEVQSGQFGLSWGVMQAGLEDYDILIFKNGTPAAGKGIWEYLPYSSITLVKETYTLEFEGTDNCDVEITSGHEIEDGKISGISEGSTVKFKLTAKEGYDVSKAIVTANGSVINPDGEGVYSVKVKSNTTVTVSGVTKKVYDVTISESSNGAYNSDAEETTVGHGGTYTFTVNVAPGYKVTNITSNVGNVENWTLSGDSIEVTISNVTDNLNITIDAAPISVTFEYSDEKLGTQKESVTVTTDDYEGKTDDILSAPADIPDAYTFDGWYVGDTEITKDNISQYFTGHDDQTVTLTAKYTFNHKEAFKADTSDSVMKPDDNGKWTWNLAVSWESIFDEYLGKATVIAGGFFYNNNDDKGVLSNITAADIEKLRNEFANQNDGSRIEYGQYKDDGSNTRAYFVEGDYAWDQADKTFTKNITNIPDSAVHCAVGWFAVQFEDGHVEYYISDVIYSITATDSGRTM